MGIVNAKSKAVVDAEKAARAEEQELQLELEKLAKTDWYVIREFETGVPVPPEISSERASSRQRASDIKARK